MPHDPNSDQTFGQYMRGGAPLGQGRTVEVIEGGQTWATKDQVLEDVPARRDTPGRKTVRDQRGHEITQETTPDGRERQHVRINLP